MQIVLPLLLVALVAMMLLLPTFSFARTAGRYVRSPRLQVSRVTRVLLTFGAFMPLVVNLGYLVTAWRELMTGKMEPDQNLAIAVLISWLAFWGRVALSRRLPRRRVRGA